jgi:hypothetical protein
MSLAGLLVHDVTILRATTTTDRYGNLTVTWSTPTETAVKGWISQRSRSEENTQRDAQISDWVLFVPADTDIVGGDRVTWNGVTYEVDGPPWRAWTPRGEHHVEASLRVVSG